MSSSAAKRGPGRVLSRELGKNSRDVNKNGFRSGDDNRFSDVASGRAAGHGTGGFVEVLNFNQNLSQSKKKPTATIRLNSYLAQVGFCSRNEADFYIANGMVSVVERFRKGVSVVERCSSSSSNVSSSSATAPKIVKDRSLWIDPSTTQVQLSQRAINIQNAKITIVLNKPQYYTSVKNIIKHKNQKEGYNFPLARRLLTPENHANASGNTSLAARLGNAKALASVNTKALDATKLKGLVACDNLGTDASGLVLFTQDGRVATRMTMGMDAGELVEDDDVKVDSSNGVGSGGRNSVDAAFFAGRYSNSRRSSDLTTSIRDSEKSGDTSDSTSTQSLGQTTEENDDVGIEDFIRKRSQHKPWEFTWEEGEEKKYKQYEEEYYKRDSSVAGLSSDAVNSSGENSASSSPTQTSADAITVQSTSSTGVTVEYLVTVKSLKEDAYSVLESQLLAAFSDSSRSHDIVMKRTGERGFLLELTPRKPDSSTGAAKTNKSHSFRRVCAASLLGMVRKSCLFSGLELETFVCCRIGTLTLDGLQPGKWMVVKNPLRSVFDAI